MWSAPITIMSLHGQPCGQVKTDGRRISMAPLNGGYGDPANSTEGAVTNALGDMPPILQRDWVNGCADALKGAGYDLTLGGLLR